MTERERPPTISDTLKALEVSADMQFRGFQICREAVKTFPFIPEQSELLETLHQQTAYSSLTPHHQEILDQKFARVYKAMEERAELQVFNLMFPDDFRELLLSAISEDLEPGTTINLQKAKITWGLFAPALVVNKEPYETLKNSFLPPSVAEQPSLGFPYHADFGRVIIVLAGQEANRTILHEDCHFYQALFSYSPSTTLTEKLLKEEVVSRILRRDSPESFDLETRLVVLGGLVEYSLRLLNDELRASLLVKEPTPSKVSSGLRSLRSVIRVGYLSLDSLIFQPQANFSEEERMSVFYESRLWLARVEYEMAYVNACVKQAIESRGGKESDYLWVASRMSALPSLARPTTIKRILLGKKPLDCPPKFDWLLPMALTLTLFAVYKIEEDFFNRFYKGAQKLSPDKIEDFTAILINLLKSDFLSKVIQRFGLETEDEEHLKWLITREAARFIPKGEKGSFKRNLEKELEVTPFI